MKKTLFIILGTLMLLTLLSACGGAAPDCADDPKPPPLEKKDTYKVGFSQVETNNPWRIAQTESMKAEAEKLGYELVYTDAGGSEAKQIADVDSMIAQKVDLIFLAPRSEQALAEAVLKAKAACIPMIMLDRDVDHSIAAPGRDYITMIGSVVRTRVNIAGVPSR